MVVICSGLYPCRYQQNVGSRSGDSSFHQTLFCKLVSLQLCYLHGVIETLDGRYSAREGFNERL